mgnify:CR=1 FL=1
MTDVYPTKKKLTCNKCNGTSFEFIWSVENEAHKLSLLYSHDGFGFQLEDAEQKCLTCGNTDSDEFKILSEQPLENSDKK